MWALTVYCTMYSYGADDRADDPSTWWFVLTSWESVVSNLADQFCSTNHSVCRFGRKLRRVKKWRNSRQIEAGYRRWNSVCLSTWVVGFSRRWWEKQTKLLYSPFHFFFVRWKTEGKSGFKWCLRVFCILLRNFYNVLFIHYATYFYFQLFFICFFNAPSGTKSLGNIGRPNWLTDDVWQSKIESLNGNSEERVETPGKSRWIDYGKGIWKWRGGL